MTMDNQSYQMVSNDIKCYPTTSTTPTSPTNISTTITTAAAATATTNTTESEFTAAATDRIVKVLGGNLGKNVVFLSEAQISDLLKKMDIDTFDHYVDKLSSFIIKNDAKVKNHYETILKWWQQDAAVHSDLH